MQRTMEPDAVKRVNLALSDHGLSALVASSYENVLYLSKVPIRTQRSIPDRLALVVWTPDRSPRLIVCTIEEVQVRAQSWIPDVIGYTEFADSPVKVLADVLTATIPGKARVGIEKRHLSAHYYEELTALCPELALVSADYLFDRLRMIKTPEEIAILGEAAQATDTVIRRVFESIRVGDTERETAIRMEEELRRSGADTIQFITVAAGGNAVLAHATPGDTTIQAGQIVRTDFGGRFGGYLSDIARTVVTRPASGKQRNTYQKLYEAQRRVIEAIRPGLPARELYYLCKGEFDRLGLDFAMPHIGHGLGIGLHEHPVLAPFTQEELQPGMVLCVEPVTPTDEGLFHTEDLVEVTDTGMRILSRSADWATLLEVG